MTADALSDTVGTDYETAYVITAGELLTNDAYNGTPTLTLPTSTANNGTLDYDSNNETWTYTPADGFSGADYFDYSLNDDDLTPDTATVTINVGSPPPNDPPSASDDSVTTDEDVPVNVDVLANDADPNSDPLTVSILNAVGIGATVEPDGSISLAPLTDWFGTAAVQYQIDDGRGGTADAWLNVTVNPVNDAPWVEPLQEPTIDEDSSYTTATPSDVEGDALEAVVVSGPSHGTLTNNGNGTLTYTPGENETDPVTFSYFVRDPSGAESGLATVNVTITPVNDPASFSPGGDVTVEEDSGAYSAGWASDISTGPANEGQTPVFVVTGNSNPGLFTAEGQPAIAPDGTLTFTLAPNAPFAATTGSATITVKLSDGAGETGEVSFAIHVTPVNDAPTVEPVQTPTIFEDTAYTTPAPSDVDGDALTAVVVSEPAHGTLTNNGDGTLSYQAGENATEPVSFSYLVRDPSGAESAVVTVNVTLTPVNDSPVVSTTAGAREFDGIDEDDRENGGTLVSDLIGEAGYATDVDLGDTLGIAVIGADTSNGDWQYDAGNGWSDFPSVAANGALLLAADGVTKIRFRPAAEYHSTATIEFRLWDGSSGTNGDTGVDASSGGGGSAFSADTGTATITVAEVNDPPSFTPGAAVVTVDEDSGAYFAAWASAMSVGPADESEQTYSFNVSDDNEGLFAPGGRPSIDGSGNLTFTPAANAHGSATVTVSLSDSEGATSAETTLTITVDPLNDAPVVEQVQSPTIDEDTSYTTPAPTDVDGDALEAVVVSGPSHGTLTNNGNGTLTFTPGANRTDGVTFSYFVRDPSGAESGVATVNVTITPVNDAPWAVNESSEVWVTHNQTDPVALEGVSNNAYGDVDGDTLDVTYGAAVMPVMVAPGTTGSTSFTVTDPSSASASAEVSLTVSIIPNRGPVAVNDQVPVSEDGEVTFDVRLNDTDEDGDTFAVTITAGPSHGTAVVNGDGTISYSPEGDYFGADSLEYSIDDGWGGTATGVVNITVTAVNDPPSFTPGAAEVTVEEDSGAYSGSWANDISTGPANEGQTPVFVVTGNSHPEFFTAEGQPAIGADGTLTFTLAPDAPFAAVTGTATITVKLSDGEGETAEVTFAIHVTPVNDGPIGSPDGYTVDEDQTLTVSAAEGVLANDDDPDGNPLSAVLVSGPNDAQSFTLNADGSFSLTPTENYFGPISFTYRATDGQVESEPVTVTIDVLPVNDIPEPSVGGLTLGEAGDFGSFTIDLAEAMSTDTTVYWIFDQVNSTAALGVDFDFYHQNPFGEWQVLPVVAGASNAIIFAAGQTQKSLHFRVIDDGVYESDESIRVSVSADPASSSPAASADSMITDNDAAPEVRILDTSVTEGDAGTTTLTMQLELVTPTEVAAQVHWRTVAGSALEDEDFIAASGTVTFGDGSDPTNDFVRTITLTIVNDLWEEGGQRFYVELTGAVDAAIVPGVEFGTVTIVDNDLKPMFTAGSDVAVLEDSGTYSAGWASDISVGTASHSFQVSDDNAGLFSAGGRPVIDSAGNLTFTLKADASGSAIVTVTLSDDFGRVSDAVAFTIDVSSVNDAPVIEAGLPPVFLPASSWAADAGGFLVSELVAQLAVSDDDSARGLFVIDLAGNWQYSVDDGLTWNAMGTVGASTARLLAADLQTRIRFVPAAAHQVGTLTAGVWDRYSGTNGSLVDVTERGAATPYSLNVVDFQTAAANRVPVAAGRSFAVDEDQAKIFDPLAGVSDPDGDDFQYGGVILGATNGTVSYDSTTGLVTYTPNAGWSGSDEFTLGIVDEHGGTTALVVTMTVGYVVSVAGHAESEAAGKATFTITLSQPAAASVMVDWAATDLTAGRADYGHVWVQEVPAYPDIIPGYDFTRYVPRIVDIWTNYPYQKTGPGYHVSEIEADGVVVPADFDSFGPPKDWWVTYVEVPEITLLISDETHFNENEPDWNWPAYGYVFETDVLRWSEEVGHVDGTSPPDWNTDPGTSTEPLAYYEFIYAPRPITVPAVPAHWQQRPTAPAGSVTFAPGETSKTVELYVEVDALEEPNETFRVTLSNPAGAKLGDNTAIVTIENRVPTAGADAFSTNEDEAFTFSKDWLQLNDSDAEGQVTIQGIAVPPQHGAVTIDGDGNYIYTPAANFFGVDSVQYRIVDALGQEALGTVQITVHSVNDAPTFQTGTDLAVVSAAGPVSISNWATAIQAGPTNENGQVVTFLVTVDNPALFAVGGQPIVAADGTLAFTPELGADGIATITIKLKDDGGTGNGGIDTSAEQTFQIEVHSAGIPGPGSPGGGGGGGGGGGSGGGSGSSEPQLYAVGAVPVAIRLPEQLTIPAGQSVSFAAGPQIVVGENLPADAKVLVKVKAFGALTTNFPDDNFFIGTPAAANEFLRGLVVTGEEGLEPSYIEVQAQNYTFANSSLVLTEPRSNASIAVNVPPADTALWMSDPLLEGVSGVSFHRRSSVIIKNLTDPNATLTVNWGDGSPETVHVPDHMEPYMVFTREHRYAPVTANTPVQVTWTLTWTNGTEVKSRLSELIPFDPIEIPPPSNNPPSGNTLRTTTAQVLDVVASELLKKPDGSDLVDQAVVRFSRGSRHGSTTIKFHFEGPNPSTTTPSGTATNELVYQGEVTIPDGRSFVDVVISAVEDNSREHDEYFQLVIDDVTESGNYYVAHNSQSQEWYRSLSEQPDFALSYSGYIKVLDNDRIGEFGSRNVDTLSTGLVEERVWNGDDHYYNPYDGRVTFVMPEAEGYIPATFAGYAYKSHFTVRGVDGTDPDSYSVHWMWDYSITTQTYDEAANAGSTHRRTWGGLAGDFWNPNPRVETGLQAEGEFFGYVDRLIPMSIGGEGHTRQNGLLLARRDGTVGWFEATGTQGETFDTVYDEDGHTYWRFEELDPDRYYLVTPPNIDGGSIDNVSVGTRLGSSVTIPTYTAGDQSYFVRPSRQGTIEFHWSGWPETSVAPVLFQGLTFTTPPGSFSTLTLENVDLEGDTKQYVMRYPDGTRHMFNGRGLMTSEVDSDGNETGYLYEDVLNEASRLREVVLPGERRIVIDYVHSAKLPVGEGHPMTDNRDVISITDPLGRKTYFDEGRIRSPRADSDGATLGASQRMRAEIGTSEVHFNYLLTLRHRDERQEQTPKPEYDAQDSWRNSLIMMARSSNVVNAVSVGYQFGNFGLVTAAIRPTVPNVVDPGDDDPESTLDADIYIRDANGLITEVRTPAGRGYIFDPAKIDAIPGSGYDVEIREYYAGTADLKRVVHPDGTNSDEDNPFEFWTYDERHRVTSYRDRAGRTTHYRYDGETSMTVYEPGQDPESLDSKKTEYRFTPEGSGLPAGLVREVVDPDGRLTDYVYYTWADDEKLGGLVRKITYGAGDPDEVYEEFTYDEYRHLRTKRDVDGVAHGYLHDRVGNLLEEWIGVDIAANGTFSGGLLVAKYTYDFRGRVLSESTKNRDGLSTVSYRREGPNLLGFDQVRVIGPAAAGQHDMSRERHLLWQYSGEPAFELTAGGAWYQSRHDARGRIYKTALTTNSVGLVEPDGTPLTGRVETETVNKYDQENNLEIVRDDFGRETKYTYNIAGQVVREERPDPDGDGPLGPFVLEYKYHADGQLWKEISPSPVNDGTTVEREYLYDAAGRLERINEPLGKFTAYTYYDSGKVKTESSGFGSQTYTTTTYEYDAIGRVTKETVAAEDAETAITETKYEVITNDDDEVVLVVTVTDPREYVTKTTHDTFGRVAVVEYPVPGTTDKDGRPLPSPVTKYVYFANDGKLEKEIRTYKDAPENDPLAVTTSYTYDERGRVRTIEVGGITTTRTYDVEDRLVAEERTGVSKQVTVYNQRGNVVREEAYDLGGGAPVLMAWTSYSYDEVGNLVYKTNEVGDESYYEYDKLNRLTKERQPDYSFADDLNPNSPADKVTEYKYTAAGQVQMIVTATAATGKQVGYAYDALGRTTQIVDQAYGLPSSTTGFYYDDAARVKRVQADDGDRTYYAYDGLGRVLNEGINIASPTADNAVQFRRFEYDAAGNLHVYTDRDNRKTTYEYDGLNRNYIETSTHIESQDLRTETFYDAVGNVERLATSRNLGTPSMPNWIATSNYVFELIDVHGRAHKITQTLSVFGKTKSVVFTYAYDDALTGTERRMTTARTGYTVTATDDGGVLYVNLVQFDAVGREVFASQDLEGNDADKEVERRYYIAGGPDPVNNVAPYSPRRDELIRSQKSPAGEMKVVAKTMTFYENKDSHLVRQIDVVRPATVAGEPDVPLRERISTRAITHGYNYDQLDRLRRYFDRSKKEVQNVFDPQPAPWSDAQYAYGRTVETATRGAIEIDYDLEGHVEQFRAGEGGNVRQLRWEAGDRLVKVGTAEEFAYDAFGNLIASKIAGEVRLRFYEGGSDVLQFKSWGSGPGGAPQPGDAISEPDILWYSADGTLLAFSQGAVGTHVAYWALNDKDGTVRDWLKWAAGPTTPQYEVLTVDFDPNGRVDTMVPPEMVRFQGKIYLGRNTNGYYDGVRWTSPTFDGRTLSPVSTTISDVYGGRDPGAVEEIGWFQTAVNVLVDGWHRSSGIDRVQTVLSAAGFIPLFGAAFDLINAGIYTIRGDGVNAAVSAISAVPGIGDAFGATWKLGRAVGRVGAAVSRTARVARIGTRGGQVMRAVGVNVASNVTEQWARMHYGSQESFEWEQTLGAAVGAGSLGFLSVGVGRGLGASRHALARAGVLTAGTGAAAALGDAATQWGAIRAGRQDEFDGFRTGMAFAGGALAGGVGQLAGLYDNTCFETGTPMIWEHGNKPVEEFKERDRLWARNESDPNGPLELKEIEEIFVRRALILEVTVSGRVIGTTAEHPFYAYAKGWTPAGELAEGDLLASADGRWLPVERVYNTGRVATVYNFRIADHHTYFVGGEDWGFGVWVHNAICGVRPGPRTDNRVGHNRMIRKVAREVTAKGDTVISGGRMFDGKYRPEAIYKTIGGFKQSRRPDILVRRPDGSVYGINVGLAGPSGRAIRRERLAIQDLNEIGLEMQFVSYRKYR